MKFLLTALNAKYIHSNPGLYSLRAYANKYREHVEIAEFTINNRVETILADIYKRNPDVVAFSCYIWNWEMIQELIVEIHKILPHVPIWVGGPEVSYDAMDVIHKLPMLTGVMVGEGEVTFLELMSHYVDNTLQLNQICGLALPDGMTPQRELTDMNTLPFLYDNLDEFANKIIYYESSRGCPFRCSYCLSSIDKQVRIRSLQIVKKELQFFLDHRVSQVKFVDRTFNCNHEHAIGIWTYLKENDNGVTNFHFEISADIINEEEIQLLHSLRPGLVQLEIGVQSTNPDTLKAINRFVQFENLEVIVNKIKAGNNIHAHLDLIAGLPFESYSSFGESFNNVYALKPNQLQLGFLKMLKGSEMFQKAEEYGIRYTSKPPYEVLYTNWLSYGEVLALKIIEEMVELYYNSNQFTHTLPVLEECFPHYFEMYEALADFYQRKGYLMNSPARAYRYDVLLEFAVEVDPDREPLYVELLTFDMYLRENLKSRPNFSGELHEYKEKIRIFYQREEEQREFLKGYEDFSGKQMSKMTHLEPFYYPVWEIQVSQISQKAPLPQFMLFDYNKRDPLTHQAMVHVVGRLEER